MFCFYPYLGRWSNLTCAYCSNRLMKVQTVWRFLGAKHVPVGYSPTFLTWDPFGGHEGHGCDQVSQLGFSEPNPSAKKTGWKHTLPPCEETSERTLWQQKNPNMAVSILDSTWWQLKDFGIFTPTTCEMIQFDGPASFSRGLKLETTNLLLLTNLRICQTVSKIVRPAESHWKTAKQTHLRFMSWATISLLRTLDLFSWTVRG